MTTRNLPKIIADAVCSSPDAKIVAKAIEDYAEVYKGTYKRLKTIPFIRDMFDVFEERFDIRIDL